MSIIVTAATGNVGGGVVRRLIEQGEQVTVIVRHPDKLSSVVRDKANVQVGSLTNLDFLVEATAGAEAILWITPNNYGAEDIRQYYRDIGSVAAQAVRHNNISHVVNISSSGAHLPNGIGILSGLHDVEQALEVAANIVHLRPGYFFENYLAQLDAIRSGNVYLPIANHVRIAFVATADIAEVATQLLRDRSWSGHKIQGVHGPADLSFSEAAELLSQGINQKVTHVETKLEDFRQFLLEIGSTPNVADNYVEMFRTLGAPDYHSAESRLPSTTTPTSLATFAREIILPLLRVKSAV
ncbi:MAG: NAD(P)H-binding protein [Nostoc sp.]|uniref:NmrA family NAD(P)-binding protein n=1 Tax=Nostoc sp. TaxID=1180 RepID=UPI002FFA4378